MHADTDLQQQDKVPHAVPLAGGAGLRLKGSSLSSERSDVDPRAEVPALAADDDCPHVEFLIQQTQSLREETASRGDRAQQQCRASKLTSLAINQCSNQITYRLLLCYDLASLHLWNLSPHLRIHSVGFVRPRQLN